MEKELTVNLLIEHFKNHTYLNLALNELFHQYSLTQDEKGRITIRVYGVIQYLLFLEYELAPYLKKHTKIRTKVILYMSLYEHYFLNIPDYAIVNENIKLINNKYEKQFVNAVLRKVFVKARELPKDRLERLSIQTSHPLWLVKMLDKQYGEEVLEKILLANNQVPLKTGRINTIKIDKKQFLNTYPNYSEGKLADNSVYYHKGNIASTKEFKEGYITIQDEASQKVSEYLNPKANEKVLDMCGAPGSKTTHLAALMNNMGHIDVYDIYEHKIKLIQDNCLRLSVNIIHPTCLDATLIKEDTTYDKILLDGPCSGLGVLARKPEIKYHDSSNMDELILIQQKLLEKAYILLKNGGKLVYSTCTLNKKENEKQIELFIKKHPDIIKIKDETILPFEYHSDGFYMCLMEKK